MAASWSSKMPFESNSSLPMSVLLPSSTEPAVEKRSKSKLLSSAAQRLACAAARYSGRLPAHAGVRLSLAHLEIPLALAVFHGRLGKRVVGAGSATLRDPRRGNLEDDVRHVGGVRVDRTGAGHVPDRSVADDHALDGLIGTMGQEVARRE